MEIRKSGKDRAEGTECRRCGVCCFSASSTFVRVDGDDWSRLGVEAERHAQFIGNRAFMRMREGHCAALEVRRGAAGALDFFCTIYEQRPQACRDLARGSPQCAGEIATKLAGVDGPRERTLSPVNGIATLHARVSLPRFQPLPHSLADR